MGGLPRTFQIALLTMALVLGSAVGAHAEEEGTAWPGFNESRGCGQPQGLRSPLASRSGWLGPDELVRGPYGAFFGRDLGDVATRLVDWTVPMSNNKVIQVNELALPAFEQVAANLAEAQAAGLYYRVRSSDTFGYTRRTIGGRHAMSHHSFGTTIDINARTNPYRGDNVLVTDMPRWFVDAWTEAGFCWGGDWESVKDAMHFSWMGPAATPGYPGIPTPPPPLAEPDGFTDVAAEYVSAFAPADPAHLYLFGDGNRDGAADLFRMRPWAADTAIEFARSSFDFQACGLGDDIGAFDVPEGRIVVLGDYDGTARPDIWLLDPEAESMAVEVLAHAAGYREVAATFDLPVVHRASLQYGVADYDRDGLMDVYVFDTADGSVTIYGGGAGYAAVTLETTGPLSPAGGPRFFALGARDADGVPDLFVVDAGDAVAVTTLTGANDYSDPVVYDTGHGAADLVAAAARDFDGDGHSDVYLFDASGTVTILYGNTPIAGTTPAAWVRPDDWDCDDRPRETDLAVWADFTTPSGWTAQVVGDFNDDGRDDIASFHPGTGRWYVSRSTGAGFLSWMWADFVTNDGWTAQIVGDFTGDGRHDVANYHRRTGRWYVSRSTGVSFSTRLWAEFVTNDGWAAQLAGDFDGDGIDDIASYHRRTGRWYVSISTSASFVTKQWGGLDPAVPWSRHLVGDFDGDGRDDVASFRDDTGEWHVGLSAGTGFTIATWSDYVTDSGWTHHVAADFDGDGSDDIASYHQLQQRWYVGIARPGWFDFDLWEQYTSAGTIEPVRPGTMNSKQRADLVVFDRDAAAWYASFSTGDRFHSSRWYEAGPDATWSAPRGGDFDGDGRQDVAVFDTNTGRWLVGLSGP